MNQSDDNIVEVSFQVNEYNDEAIASTKKYLIKCFKANYFENKKALEDFIKAYLRNKEGLKLSGVDISDEAWEFFQENPDKFLSALASYFQKDLNNFPHAPRGMVKINMNMKNDTINMKNETINMKNETINMKNEAIDMKFVYNKETAIEDSLLYTLLGEIPSIYCLVHNFEDEFSYDKEFIFRKFSEFLDILAKNKDKPLKDILIKNGYLQELYPIGQVKSNLLDLITYFLYDTENISQYTLLQKFIEIIQVEDNLEKTLEKLIKENFSDKNLEDFLNDLQMQALLLFKNLDNKVF